MNSIGGTKIQLVCTQVLVPLLPPAPGSAPWRVILRAAALLLLSVDPFQLSGIFLKLRLC